MRSARLPVAFLLGLVFLGDARGEERVVSYASPHLTKEAGSGSAIIRRLEPGERVDVTAHDGSWVRVRTERGETGWVRRSQLREPLR